MTGPDGQLPTGDEPWASPTPGYVPTTVVHGQPVYGGIPPQQQGNPGTAVAGFVLGLVGLVFSLTPCTWFLGVFLGIVGLPLAIVGRNAGRRRGSRYGLGTAGIVLSILAVAGAVVMAILFVSVLASA